MIDNILIRRSILSSSHYFFILRHHAIHKIPKRFLVIFFSEVREFMDDNGIDKRRINTHRRHRHIGIIFSESHILIHLCLCVCLLQIFRQPITETQSIFTTTTSPSSFRFCDLYASEFWEIFSFPDFTHTGNNIFFERFFEQAYFYFCVYFSWSF